MYLNYQGGTEPCCETSSSYLVWLGGPGLVRRLHVIVELPGADTDRRHAEIGARQRYTTHPASQYDVTRAANGFTLYRKQR